MGRLRFAGIAGYNLGASCQVKERGHGGQGAEGRPQLWGEGRAETLEGHKSCALSFLSWDALGSCRRGNGLLRASSPLPRGEQEGSQRGSGYTRPQARDMDTHGSHIQTQAMEAHSLCTPMPTHPQHTLTKAGRFSLNNV